MVIESHQLSAGAFADKIGVQRSNVSHVLSGRNKPGFEFLEKVLLAFPKVQAHWLLTGKQLKQDPEIKPVASSSLVTEEDMPAYGFKAQRSNSFTAREKKVVKIVTFYSDFTFDSYFPNAE